MSADPGARIVDVEVPFGCGCAYHVHDIDMQAFEDQGELVHQSDVEVPLNVLDDFCRFRCLDVLDGHNVLCVILVKLSCQLSPVRSYAANNSNDVKDAVRCISRIIPFRAVGQPEIGSRL